MSCKVKTKTINNLKSKNAISKNGEVLDFPLFDKLNNEYTKLAVEKYDLTKSDKLLFEVVEESIDGKTVFKIEPNELMFEVLDDVVNEYKENNDVREFPSDSTKDLRTLEGKNVKPVFYSKDRESMESAESVEDVVNQNEFIFFNNHEGNSFTVEEVMDNVMNNFQDFQPETKQIIEKMLPLLERSGAKITFISEKTLEGDLMQYDSLKNEIQISRDVLNTLGTDQAIRTLLHEVVHSLTVNSYLSPNTENQKMFKTFIDDMFAKYVALSGYNVNDSVTERNYGFTNAEEFMAEIMTNPEFQEEVKSLDKKGLWDTFVDYIRTLVGLKKTSEYNQIIDHITEISKDINTENNYSNEEIIYKKKATDPDFDLNKDDIYYKLDTIEKKLEHIRKETLDSLYSNIRYYDNIIKTIKNPEKLQKFNEKQKELLEELEFLGEADYWTGIINYTKSLASSIGSLERNFRKLDLNDEDISKTLSLYKKYLETNSLVDKIQSLLSDARGKPDLLISEEEMEQMRDSLIMAIGRKETLEKDFKAFNDKIAFSILNKRSMARDVLHKWRNKLRLEHKNLNISEPFESWFIGQVTEDGKYTQEVDDDVAAKAREIIDDPTYDISQQSYLFDATLDTNSDIIQVANNLMIATRNNKIERNRELANDLQILHEEFIKENGDKKPSELYKNLYETTKQGETILKGLYSIKFKEEYEAHKEEFNSELAIAKKKYGVNSQEVANFYDNSKYKKWKDVNILVKKTEDGNEYQVPADKWLNSEKGMTASEVKLLRKSRLILKKSDNEKFRNRSLLSDPIFGAVYYKLPSLVKSDLERAIEGNAKGFIKDKVKDLRTIRPDDLGYEEENVDSSKNSVSRLRVNYRGKLDADQQSLDLFTLILAEGYNGINFQENFKAESEANIILDLARNKEYYKSTGYRVPVLGRNVVNNKLQTKLGTESYTYKKLESMVESNLYDILNKSMGKLAGIDVQKAMGMANAWTGMIGMSLAEVASAVNVLNGKTQIFLEGLAGDGVSLRSLMKAEGIYLKSIHENLRDVNKPIGTSFANQLNTMWDTFGSVNASVEKAFIENTMMKSNLNFKSLQFMQKTGEHWIQSVITMGVLENIQVLNKDGKFINKEGKVVADKKDAASMLDMLKKNKDGLVEMDPSVVYTTHTLGLKYDEGGKEKLTLLIKKKVHETNGNYDPNTQPEILKQFGISKMFMMYRKYFISMGTARLKGFAHVGTKQSELEPHQLFFSEAHQEYETGTYTEFVRFFATTLTDMIKEKKLSILKTNWEELTDYQKKQMVKAVAELVITAAILPAAMMLFQALQEAGDGDDDSYAWYLMLITTRLQSELSSFRSIKDQWRVIKSPIPSLQVLEGSTNLINSIFSPSEWGDVIEGGDNEGRNKMSRDFQKLIPVIKNKGITYKTKYNFIKNQTN